MKGIVGILAALVFLLAACGTDEEAPAQGGAEGSVAVGQEPVPASPSEVSLDFGTCEGFLDDPATDLVSKTSELTVAASNDNPGVEAMCMVSHQAADGSKAMTLAVTRFASNDAADSQYNVTRSSLEVDDPAQFPEGAQFNEGVDGRQSYQAVVNTGGIGSMVVIRKELVVISMHTAMPSGETPLLDSGELLDVAKGVSAKLR